MGEHFEGAHFGVEVKQNCVVKTPTPLFLSTWNLDEWVEVVNSLSDIPGIQPIHLENGKIIQPIAPGKALVDMGMSVNDERVKPEISRVCAEVRSRGYNLENIHHGNAFYDSETGKVTIVDLGQLKVIKND